MLLLNYVLVKCKCLVIYVKKNLTLENVHIFFVDHEVQDRNEEKNELAKALTRSYEELQKVRTNSAQVSSTFSVDLPL